MRRRTTLRATGEVVVHEAGTAASAIGVAHHPIESLPVAAGLERLSLAVERHWAVPGSHLGRLGGAQQEPHRRPGGESRGPGLSQTALDLLRGHAGAEQAPDVPDQLGRRVGTGQEELLGAHVGRGEQQRAARGKTVAARPPDLLIVGLDAAGQLGMHHEADVGLVHSHAEGVGRRDHIERPGEERVLNPVPVVVVHAGVIASGSQPQLAQVIGPEVHRLAGGAVDDPRCSHGGQHLPQRAAFVLAGAAPLDRQREIGPLEPRNQLHR